MEKQQRLILKKYIDLLYRWRMLLILLLLISLPVGLFLYIKTPKVYMASSLLSYQQQKVNPNKMSPDVQSRIKDIVSTLSQIVLSRTNLEGLITTFDLYKEQREKLPMEDVIEQMRNRIEIVPSRLGDTFLITYEGGNPNKVVKITNALAAKFIEENLKYREERATETSAYTTNELAMAKSTMDAKEASMRDYKLKYYNEMPDQREANVARLVALQEQYQGIQTSILELQRMTVLIQEQVAHRRRAIAAQESAMAALIAENGLSGDKNLDVETNAERLRRLNLYLDSLLVKYTEIHPEVRRTKKTIEKLKAEMVAQSGEESSTGSTGSGRNLAATDKDLMVLRTQLMNASLKVEALEKEKDLLTEKIRTYEEWVAATPVREAEWASLTREYRQLKNHYDNLVAQDLQAKSMLNLERQQKGSQFKIEDPARLPEKPVKPDFMKIMSGAVAGSLMSGGAIILLFGVFDGSFREPEDIESYLGVPVYSTIAYAPTGQEKKKRKLITVGNVIVILSGVILVAGLFWYAWSRGKIQL